MRKTQIIYLLKTIRKNIVSFFAVGTMAITGISIYLGDQSAAQAILNAANNYFVENNLQSLEVSSPYGITEEDIEVMAGWKGVDAVEGGFSDVVLMDSGNGKGKTLIQAHALLDTMNIPVILEGTLPTEVNEVAVEQILAENEGVAVGDTITVENKGQLKTDQFVVTAIINEPAYCYAKISDSRGKSDVGIGSAYYYISFPKEAFDLSYYDGCYTTAYIKNNDLDQYYYFSDEYKEKEALFRKQIMELGKERARLRYNAVKIRAQEGLEDGWAEINRQEKNLASGKEMMTAILNLIGLPSDFEEAKEALDSYEKIKEPLNEIFSAFDTGEEALADARERLLQAEEKAENLQYYDWIVSVRNDIGDVRSIGIAVQGLYGLSYSMSVIFVIVASTVCYAAISRMISESRTLIGMQKALGFNAKEIMRHFMSYSIICGLWGVLGGWLVAFAVVQSLNLSIYKTVFLLREIPLTFAWNHAGFVSVLFMLIFIVSSYAACTKEISLQATDLLRGIVPQKDYTFSFENWKFYQRLRLYTKTMIKNVLEDKSRMMTTVMGVSGCTTLLVISFTLLFAMDDSNALQFKDYFLYENRLVIDTEKTDGNAFEELLEEKEISNTRIQDKLKYCREIDGEWAGAHVIAVSDEQELKDFMVLEDVKTREILDVPENGVLVSVKCAENYGLKEGSEFELMASDGTAKRVTVAGVIEHYLAYNLIVMSESYYEESMGEEADACVFLLKGSIDELYDNAKDMEGFISIRDNSEYHGANDAMNIIVIICFAFAALMAVLVMLNQNVMYINQKARELSVMRINGFTLKETKTFVSRDNFVLTALGILLGWIIGAALGYLVLRVLEVGVTHYIRTPNLKACLSATAICGFFAYLMNKIALRKVQRLNLTNVNAN